MEAHPPSYSQATLVDYWDIVARYMPSNDLCTASLVCSTWHATFARHLWGNPASHFGLENDRVYVALTKFKRTLRTARLLVRSMTHTLHLPPAHAEIYYGPHSDWLRDTLDRLPNLQSLIVRSLPFFDHSALLALKQPSRRPAITDTASSNSTGASELPGSIGFMSERPSGTVPSFGLRLLDASRCSNVTSGGLALALNRFENLLYLDLSFTYAARDPQVLSTLRRSSGLQVLKLRGINLKDEGVETLTKAIGLRVRSLDLRNNHITDYSIRTLLDSCFASSDHAAGDRTPSLLPYLGSEMLGIYQNEDFEGYLRNAFTQTFVSRLAIEDVPEGGITHLYIADNRVTVEGISGLLRCKRLHVLDVGSPCEDMARLPSMSSGHQSDLIMPSMEKLTRVLESCAASSMTFLRIDHSLITKDPPNQHPEEVVSGRVELADTSMLDASDLAVELDGTAVRPPTFEMSAEPPTPRYELEADPMSVTVSSPPRRTQGYSDEKESNSPSFRRGSALAPEVIEDLSMETDHMSLLSPATAFDDGEGTMCSGAISPITNSNPTTHQNTMHRPRSYSATIKDRRARLNGHKASSSSLHPAMLPKLRALILTNVPPYSTSQGEADHLIRFVKLCAEESHMAVTQAKLDYSLPPGRKGQANALRQSAQKHFAMRKLVLEIESERHLSRSARARPWQHTKGFTGKSMTEDRDSEALWSAAETDFSFFGEQEDMFPSIESGPPTFVSGEKEVSFGNDSAPRPPPPSQSPISQQPPQASDVPKIDNIALLSAFRRERKLAHDRNLAAGAVDPETEGYWSGLIQVVRPGQGQGEQEESDYYGNAFSVGYLYR